MLIPSNSNRLVVAGKYSDIHIKRTFFALEVNTRRLQKFPDEVRKRVRRLIQTATLEIQEATLGNIRDKDIIDTGALMNSVQGRTTLDGMMGFVEVGVYYAVYHEYGTVKMAARPFLGPAVEFVGPSFIQAVRQAVREAANAA